MVENCMRGNVNEQSCSCLMFACGRFAWRTALLVQCGSSPQPSAQRLRSRSWGPWVKCSENDGCFGSSLILFDGLKTWYGLVWILKFACITSNWPGRKLAQRMRALNLVPEEMSYWESNTSALFASCRSKVMLICLQSLKAVPEYHLKGYKEKIRKNCFKVFECLLLKSFFVFIWSFSDFFRPCFRSDCPAAGSIHSSCFGVWGPDVQQTFFSYNSLSFSMAFM